MLGTEQHPGLEADLTGRVIGAAIEVHRALGAATGRIDTDDRVDRDAAELAGGEPELGRAARWGLMPGPPLQPSICSSSRPRVSCT